MEKTTFRSQSFFAFSGVRRKQTDEQTNIWSNMGICPTDNEPIIVLMTKKLPVND